MNLQEEFLEHLNVDTNLGTAIYHKINELGERFNLKPTDFTAHLSTIQRDDDKSSLFILDHSHTRDKRQSVLKMLEVLGVEAVDVEAKGFHLNKTSIHEIYEAIESALSNPKTPAKPRAAGI